MGCKHSSFPNLTLFNLAIAEQRVNTVIFVINLAGKRHACRSGNALTERAGAHIDARGTLHIRVTLQHSADVAEFFQLIHREIAALCQCSVKTRCAVAFGKDKTVSVRILRVLRVNVQFFEIEIGENIRSGKGTARMAGFGVVNAFDDSKSDFGSRGLKLLLIA